MNKILLLIIPISLLLTGCYDYKEINSIAIASATEITKENGEYITTIQAINPQAPNKTTVTQAPFVIYSEKGKTLQEAYRKISLKSSRFIYSSQLQLLIINEELYILSVLSWTHTILPSFKYIFLKIWNKLSLHFLIFKS